MRSSPINQSEGLLERDWVLLSHRGYKYELKLNNKERSVLAQFAGTSRFAWNWGLAQRLTRYKEQEGQERYTDAMKQLAKNHSVIVIEDLYIKGLIKNKKLSRSGLT